MPAASELEPLRAAVNSFCARVLTCAAPDEASRPGTWSPHDVLAHLAFWHEVYARALEALVLGTHPRLLTGTFRQWNDLAVRQATEEPVGLLVERFRRAQGAIEGLVKLSEGRPFQVQIKEGSKARNLEVFLDRVTAHIKGHTLLLGRHARSALRPS